MLLEWIKEMSNIDKRIEHHTQSILALFLLLQKIRCNPSQFSLDTALINALKSQGALAKYENKAHGISASSLNTLKRTCVRSLEGGFDAFDQARNTALQALQDNTKKMRQGNKITRDGMSLRIQELEKQNQLLRQDLLLLSQLLNKSMSQAYYYAKQADKEIIHILCEKEQKEIRAFLSVSANANNTSNLLSVIDHA